MGRKGGKYAHLIHKLPRLENNGNDPRYQDQVNNTISEIKDPITDDDVRAPTSGEIQERLSLLGAEYAQLVRAVMRGHGGNHSTATYSKMYRDMRAIKDGHEEVEFQINLVLEAVNQMLVQKHEEDGTDQTRLATGESITIQYEPYAKVVDKEAFRAWCVEQGLESQMALAWQTTNSLVKDRQLAGLPDPPGVECNSKAKPVLRKG